MLSGTLDESLLGNILSSKRVKTKSQGRGINRAGKSQGINRAGEGFIRAGYGSHSSKLDF